MIVTFSGRVSTLNRIRPRQSRRTIARDDNKTVIGLLATYNPYFLIKFAKMRSDIVLCKLTCMLIVRTVTCKTLTCILAQQRAELHFCFVECLQSSYNHQHQSKQSQILTSIHKEEKEAKPFI